MSTVKLNVKGGFVWIFSGAETADVGLVRAPTGSRFQHRMVLEVDQGRIVPGETTHQQGTGTPVPGKLSYNLEGDVRLTIDGVPLQAKKLKRTVSTAPTPTPNPNDFFHVYRIGRLAEGVPPTIRADWPRRLTVRLPLSAGTLEVSGVDPQPCTFEDGLGRPVAEPRDLATTISYTSDVKALNYVEVSANGGKIRMTAGSDLAIDLKALCDCGSVHVPSGAPLPGFDDVFQLYDDTLDPAFRITPRKSMKLSGHTASVADDGPSIATPGPDCPPTEHA